MKMKMKEHIKNLKNTLMPYLVDVTEARVWGKEMEQENQTKDIALELDATIEQENLDDWEEGVKDHPELDHLSMEGLMCLMKKSSERRQEK